MCTATRHGSAAEHKAAEQRRAEILKLGVQWIATDDTRIPKNNLARLKTIEYTFGSNDAITSASKEDITRGLLSLHAFEEQLRFTKGGLQNLPKAFWSDNADNVERVRRSISHLIHEPGDFIIRLHDLLYDKRYKLGLFARFCALEPFGTIKPAECPPANSRVAKALRIRRQSLSLSQIECAYLDSREPPHRGSTVEPMSASSIDAAHWRPSRIAQTTSDWPRRMSPQA
jgi:hypothetical protein